MKDRCEVCEVQDALFSCTIDGQPTLWFCLKHYEEHKRTAHPPIAGGTR